MHNSFCVLHLYVSFTGCYISQSSSGLCFIFIFFLWMNIVDSTKKVAWIRKWLQIESFWGTWESEKERARFREEFIFLDRETKRERKSEQEEEGNQLFLFLFYIERFFFFAHFFPFRSCVGEVFDQYSHNFLFFCCCYAATALFLSFTVQYFFSLTIYSIAFTNILYRMRWLNWFQQNALGLGKNLLEIFDWLTPFFPLFFLSSLLLLRYIRLLVECVLSEFLYSLFFYFIYPHTLSLTYLFLFFFLPLPFLLVPIMSYWAQMLFGPVI